MLEWKLIETIEALVKERDDLKRQLEGAAFDAQDKIGGYIERIKELEARPLATAAEVVEGIDAGIDAWFDEFEKPGSTISASTRFLGNNLGYGIKLLKESIKSRLEALPSEPPVIKESLTTQEVLALVGEAMRNVGDLNLKTRATILTELKRLLAERGVTYDPERLEHFAAWWNTVIPDDERKIRDQHLGDYFNEYPQPERNPAPFDRRALLMEFAKRMQSTKYVFLYSRESLVDAFLAEHQPDEAPSEEQAK